MSHAAIAQECDLCQVQFIVQQQILDLFNFVGDEKLFNGRSLSI